MSLIHLVCGFSADGVATVSWVGSSMHFMPLLQLPGEGPKELQQQQHQQQHEGPERVIVLLLLLLMLMFHTGAQLWRLR